MYGDPFHKYTSDVKEYNEKFHNEIWNSTKLQKKTGHLVYFLKHFQTFQIVRLT